MAKRSFFKTASGFRQALMDAISEALNRDSQPALEFRFSITHCSAVAKAWLAGETISQIKEDKNR